MMATSCVLLQNFIISIYKRGHCNQIIGLIHNLGFKTSGIIAAFTVLLCQQF